MKGLLAVGLLLLATACGPSAVTTEPALAAPVAAPPAPTPLVAPDDKSAPPHQPQPEAKPRCITVTLDVGVGPTGYRASGEQCDGLREGPWTFVFLSGERHREGLYKAGLEHGPWTLWYQSGTKRSEGSFAQGQRIGTWLRYHPNGTRSLEGTYEAGLRNGRWRRWHNNGQLYEDRVYVQGTREGAQHRWNPDGLLQYARLCKSDVCKVLCQVAGKATCAPIR